VAVAAALVIAVLAAIVIYQWTSAGPTRPAATAAPRPSPSASKLPTTAEIFDAVAPSVVSIVAVAPGKSGREDSGTGIVVNADGTILTALHVVKGAGAIHVTFADGTNATAKVTATDPTIDIATLGPDALPSIVVPALLGSSDRIAIGDDVVAIGNPLGLTDTTTAGVVSGLNRLAENQDGTHLSGLIQFDAAVNPGSSGGPLLDAKGETIGIVVALANPTTAGTFIGIGFAVPIGTAVAAGGGDRAPQQ
jgi:S1-C subfamily serine protease